MLHVNSRDYLTVVEAAELLGLHPGTLRNQRSNRRELVPSVELGGRVYYDRLSVEAHHDAPPLDPKKGSMSQYRDRVGQQVGEWLVVADHARSRRGRVIWKLVSQDGTREKYLHTSQVIALDRRLSAGLDR